MAIASTDAEPPWQPHKLVEVLKLRKKQQQDLLQSASQHFLAMEKIHKEINNELGAAFCMGPNLNEFLNSALDAHNSAIDTAIDIIECNSDAEPWRESLNCDEDEDLNE